MTRPLRIAIGQVSSESNHFAPGPADLEFFRTTGYLCEGESLLELRHTDTEVGGFLSRLQTEPVEVVPLLASRGNSSGPLTAYCYRFFRTGLVDRLATAAPVDGILLSCHGSMAAEGEDDSEGDLAAALRACAGSVPLVMTLDLHSNVTRRMVENCTAILCYRTYPHEDAFETGERAADLLLATLRSQLRPLMARVRVPMLLTAYHASTRSGPFAQIVDRAIALEEQPGILSTSVCFVGSYLDVPEMQSSAIVVTDADADLASRTATELAAQYWARRAEFEVESLSVAAAMERGRAVAGGPILLLDTADTTGGGAAGDSIALVAGLLDARVSEPSFAMVVDPEAAARCCATELNGTVDLEVGHRVDPKWGSPLQVRGQVTRKSDGRFRYCGGILGGTWSSMGPCAVVAVGSIRLLVQTYPTYDWADEQYRSVGLNAETAKFVGVKNMMNYRVGYAGVMKDAFVLDTPGPTPPDFRLLPMRRVARPVYPLDPDTPFVPEVDWSGHSGST